MADLFPIKADLSEAASNLVTRVANGFGVLYEPTRIRREARAKADALIISTNADTQAAEIVQRAHYRVKTEEIKAQRNLEDIFAQAVPQIEHSAQPDKIEEDWLANFFEKSKLTSDEEMQVVWAKLLASESNEPGTFTKRTINLVAEMEKQDARLFTQLASYAWDVSSLNPIIYDVQDEIYLKGGINFDRLSHLDALGLIKFDNIAGFVRHSPGQMGGSTIISYFGSKYRVRFSETQQFRLDTGKVMLTTQGEELIRICSPEVNRSFEKYVVEKLKSQNIEISKL